MVSTRFGIYWDDYDMKSLLLLGGLLTLGLSLFVDKDVPEYHEMALTLT